MNRQEVIERDTRALALPQGRKVGDPGHDVALRYLERRLTEMGLSPFKGSSLRLDFERAGVRFTNLVGVIRGGDSSLPPVLVGAHYDSAIRGPSADDNATAVAVCLAIAERYRSAPLKRDLYIALFDSEEPPYFRGEAMGSKRFYEDHCGEIRFGLCVIMDLIGHDIELPEEAGPLQELFPSGSELLAVTGCESHPALPAILQQAIKREQALKVLPLNNELVGDMSDHHAFRLGGEPYLFLSCGEGKYYHDVRDDVGWINFEKVAHVERLVAALLETAAEQLPDEQASGQKSVPKGNATFELEVSQIKAVFGESLPQLLALFGLGERLESERSVALFYRQISWLVRRGGI